MDFTIWSQILYELTFSVSGEQELNKLVQKAATAFLKKLDCAHVSILQYTGNQFEPLCVIPRVTLKDPAYHELIAEFKQKLGRNQDRILIIPKKEGLHYYGFPLQNFGLLIMGRSEPVKEMLLKELLPVTSMLAQNCYFNFESARKHRAIETELETERHLLREILDAIPDLIFYKDTKGTYKIANKATAKFLSLSPKEIIGRTDPDIHSLSKARKCKQTDLKAIESGCAQRYEIQLKHYDDRLFPFETLKAPIYDPGGKCIGTVSVCRDITVRKRYERQLKYIGAHDQLTGLYNRRFLVKEIGRLDTPQQLPLSIIMGDLNGLKLANDVFGHRAGDNLLMEAAKILRKACREEDLIARWGGDEFLIFLPQTSTKTAGEISQRIKDKCRSQNCGPLQISIALGCATKNRSSDNIWQVLKEANDKMYSDKIIHLQHFEKMVMASLKTALFKKSRETEEHVARLKIMCKRIGKQMGLGPQQLEKLELLAMFHDIGKVAIEENILMKNEPLTAAEWSRIKKHPEIGYRFARAIPELSPIAEYIFSHHERWDGQGYPRGIKAKDIPLLARILAVADAFDAMTNDRTYRKAITCPEALAKIKRNAGTQFDPEIVHVLLNLVPQEGLKQEQGVNCALENQEDKLRRR